MNATAIEIQSLERLRSRYQTMLDYCTDAIKQLTGFTPENATFVFAVNEIPIVSIPVGEEEGNFCVSFFMSWHQFYSRKLKDTAALLNNLYATGQVAV